MEVNDGLVMVIEEQPSYLLTYRVLTQTSKMITVKDLTIPDVKILMPHMHQDARGYFAEVWHEKQMQQAELPIRFVQENQSLSQKIYTVRGLHAQKTPHQQAKLLRVLRGSIFDVAVDIRPSSPTYGQHVSAVLTAEDLTQIYIPVGFLHGFCTLQPATVVLYKISDFYDPHSETGVVWDDPDLGIAWPFDKTQATLSDKDARLPSFKDFHNSER
jgi:dTDP-4-dehydrorhamnose 3,5-epimerase